MTPNATESALAGNPPPYPQRYAPVITDSTLVGAAGHAVYAIRVSPCAADAPWPQFQHDARHTGSADAL
jgi:hypothetical protein